MATQKTTAGIHFGDDPRTDSPSVPSTPSSRSSSISLSSDSMVHSPISVIHESTFFQHRVQMGYLQAYEEDILKLTSLSTTSTTSTPLAPSPPCDSIEELTDMDVVVEKKHEPFVTTIPEIMLGIFRYLNPIDAVCFSLTNKYTRSIYVSHGQHHLLDFQPPLQIGRPESVFPVIPGPQSSCKHCCPVAFFPAHCELHFHLRSFMPSNLTFCAGQCQLFTECEPFDPQSCGSCGRNYRKQFERGRRMINVVRPEGRTYKWYEQPRLDRENRAREDRRRQRRHMNSTTTTSTST